jgi:ATP/maltotriose-dependent transcriptional regulator MalT
MSAITTEVFLVVLALLVCSVAIWRSTIFRKRANQQSKLLAETSETLEEVRKKLTALQEKDKQYKEFQDSLDQAEITTRLQKSRLSTQQYNRSMSAPERYRYVHSLAASGMSSEEISQVLSISIHEAEQLVNLSRLAHPQ